MRDMVADHMRDWLTLGLTGLGISFAPHEYLGGLFLALAGAAFAMRTDPERDERELWLVLLGAFFASHVAAICAHIWVPEIPPQLVMATAGFFSRRATRFALNLGGAFERRSDKLADRLIGRVLPDDHSQPGHHGRRKECTDDDTEPRWRDQADRPE